MNVLEAACSTAARIHWKRQREEGTGNRDPETWGGMEPHKVSPG